MQRFLLIIVFKLKNRKHQTLYNQSQFNKQEQNTMRQFLKILIVLIIMASFSFLACDQFNEKFEENFEQELAFSSEGQLTLQNANGTVTVSSWPEEKVKIIAHKCVRARTRKRAEYYMKDLKIDIQHDMKNIEIEADHPAGFSGGNLWKLIFSGNHATFSIDYEILVPLHTSLDLSTTNGKVEVEKVTGEMDVRCTNGQLTLSAVVGNIFARTTNGSIRAEVLAFPENGRLELKTTNGKITVDLPEDIHADISAQTTNGSIHTDLPVETTRGISGNKLSGKIGNGGGEIDLHTTNGSISIRKLE
jgi:DUF4097 and DUF4098 domain-containing protein YvlB